MIVFPFTPVNAEAIVLWAASKAHLGKGCEPSGHIMLGFLFCYVLASMFFALNVTQFNDR